MRIKGEKKRNKNEQNRYNLCSHGAYSLVEERVNKRAELPYVGKQGDIISH